MTPPKTPPQRWAVALISSRESPATLQASVQAVLNAAQAPTHVDVLVNGNPDLAAAMAQQLPQLKPPSGVAVQLRLWHIALGDKANAINTYLHSVWPGADTTFFVDGYVRPHTNAMAQLHDALAASPQHLAASAVPSMGRSAPTLAQRMAHTGGLHGNLHAITATAMQSMREQNFRLPTGLYRTDSTVGAALAFGLAPERQGWAMAAHILTVPSASWDLDVAPIWQPGMLRTRWNRRLRQAQGDVENWAVRFWFSISKRRLGTLPATVQQLVQTWCQQDPTGAAERVRWHPLRRHALNRLLAQPASQPAAQTQAPACLLTQAWPAAASDPSVAA
jgi:hypothetical protein